MKVATDSLADLMRSWSERVDHALDRYLGEDYQAPGLLREAMRYSLFAGGKRLRPLLVLLAADACMGALDKAMPAACAVEMIHTYSLIHDDLPAMDDDDLRRGRPTCHRQFDEATAILAGDALLTQAFGLLATIEPPVVAGKCVAELAHAAGAPGMVGGQVDDLHPPEGEGTLDWLESLHSRKTGALLTVCLRLGGLVSGTDQERLDGLTAYGQRIGLAFQIADDLLDVEGSAEAVGKEVGKDSAAGKRTYPSLLGVDESRDRARVLVREAREHLAPLGPAGHRLASLADFIVERDH
ncbi:Farnesyl diphosphate synthase [Planctomycetes bacterium Pan216]|uniref:Farnesyl diphosphate synthase n=1 Tax=Kolteria novifilia TaxID=2527975 RepID=A0A518B822_9BACT|nr:Farnesyl diphosphate synthase [Planctomycetes bacterium Pan216]